MELAKLGSVGFANELRAKIPVAPLPDRRLAVLLDKRIDDPFERPGLGMVNVAILKDDRFAGLGTANVILGVEDLELEILAALENRITARFIDARTGWVFFRECPDIRESLQGTVWTDDLKTTARQPGVTLVDCHRQTDNPPSQFLITARVPGEDPENQPSIFADELLMQRRIVENLSDACHGILLPRERDSAYHVSGHNNV